MSYRRRQATLARAVAGARPRNLNPKGWGENIEVGAQVTSFGRHGVGQPAIDGEVVWIENHEVGISFKTTHTVGRRRVTETVVRRRSISNVRRVG